MLETVEAAATTIPASAESNAGAYSTALPRDYYVSEAIFEKEIEKVFSRQWIFAGHLSELRDVGDYIVTDFLSESIVVVRETEDRLNAYFNVCRHRGYPVCQGRAGNAKVFVCRYHQWTYNLDGTLKRAPMMADGECFDYADWGLQRAPVETWSGMVFVWLGKSEPPPLAKAFGMPDETLTKLEPANIKEVFRETLDINANWKVLLENYLECYHCAGSHPELSVAMDLSAMYATTDGWQAEYFHGALPLKAGMKTVSMDGCPVSKPLGGLTGEIPEGLGAGFGVVPTLFRAIFHADHAVAHSMRPVSVDRVKWESRWYVKSDAEEGKDYDVDTLTKVWRETNREDIGLCEGAYRGVKSSRFVPGPLNPRAESAIPPALRVYLELMT